MVTCLQCDELKIVTGLMDGRLEVWDRRERNRIFVVQAHTSLVSCLQCDEKVIVSGSYDSTVKVS